MANPTLLTIPLAQNGDKNIIPVTASASSGVFSQEKGWQNINSLPVQQGGIAPDRLDFNGAFNLLSTILFYAQKGWQFIFDENQDYYAGCIVRDPTDSKLYMAKNDVSASSTEPHSDSTNWQMYDLSAYLPLDGGAMTGRYITRNVDDSRLTLCGSTDPLNGAFVEIIGKYDTSTFFAGGVRQYATDSEGVWGRLALAPDQLLYRAGGSKSDVDEHAYDLGGSAIVAKSITTNGYIQYADRLLIQWGVITIPNTAPFETEVVYPISYNEPARVTLTPFLQNSTIQQVAIKDQSAAYNKFTVQASGYCYVYWHAIGYK
jgi:hypothetical protein